MLSNQSSLEFMVVVSVELDVWVVLVVIVAGVAGA